jgi:hypothetical protein
MRGILLAIGGGRMLSPCRWVIEMDREAMRGMRAPGGHVRSDVPDAARRIRTVLLAAAAWVSSLYSRI